MSVERALRIFAGFMVMLSLGLGVAGSPIFVHSNFLWLTLFVGANLFQFGFTGFCPMAMLLKKLGLKEGACC